MLSLPGEPTEHIGQAPLVRMPDRAEELRLLLSVIFLHEFLEDLRGRPELAILLEIATKYQASRVRQRAIAMLSLEFPSTLADYDALRSDSEPARQTVCKDEIHFWALTTATIKAARRSHAEQLLPTAYLRAASRSMPDILAHQHALESAELNVLLVGREKVAQLARQEAFYSAFNPPGCGECEWVWRELRNHIEVSANYFDPFYVAAVDSWHRWKADSNCFCIPTHQDHQRKREFTWGEVPAAFGLPDWDKLLEDNS
ncbi:hypothetical protein PsYK624_093240 [Phanerochaete sordida]|uniref:Uncharacterized protein n=1 Tax=Phanerochaete sordida TaxID=48140 RepID=A0A9P3GG92_9APHY|nr:hypothetical protein PsYK624_093240 [Phanerochaete sordida]